MAKILDQAQTGSSFLAVELVFCLRDNIYHVLVQTDGAGKVKWGPPKKNYFRKSHISTND